MSEVVWDMSQAPYSLDASGDAKVITAQAIADADAFFNVTANKDTTLVLYYPPGDYNFYGTPTTDESAGIRIIGFVPGGTNDLGKLVFKGSGHSTKFIIHNNQSHNGTASTSQYGILCRNCYRIHFCKFHLTVAQQTVSQGTVQAVGTGTVDLFIPPGFRTPDELAIDPQNAPFGKFLRRYTYAFDSRNPRIIENNNAQIQWTAAVDQGDGIWRFSTTPSGTVVPYEIGSVIGIKGRHGKDPFRIVTSTGIELHDLKLTRKTRTAFITCPNAVIKNMLIERESINGIVACLASPEGGPQLQNTVGGVDSGTVTEGLVVSGCSITGAGDDCIGLFEQSGMVVGNIVRDGFARGIVNVRPGVGLSSAEVLSMNALIRSPYEYLSTFG